MKNFITVWIFLLLAEPAFAEIRITEAMPSNGELRDFFNDNSDWIELYNPENTAANLADYRLSDKKNYSEAFDLSGIIIPPNSYKIIFASGRNSVISKYVIRNKSLGFQYYIDSNEFHYEYVKIAGDFSAELSFCCFTRAGRPETCCGLMLRRSKEMNSEYSALLLGEEYITLQTRNSSAIIPDSAVRYYDYMQKFPNVTVRIERKGDSVCFSRSTYSGQFIPFKVQYLPAGPCDSLMFGICATSGHWDKEADFVLNSLIINGTAVSFNSLSKLDIGLNRISQSGYESEYHTNFKLSSTESETIRLWNSKKKIVSSLTLPAVSEKYPCGVSAAIDSAGKVVFSSPATPCAENANFYSGITSTPIINYAGMQWQADPISVFITSSEAGAEIRYTLDGSTPTASSAKYNGEIIEIDSSRTLRAAAFQAGKIQSFEAVKTFFIGDSSTLPVFALTMDPADLFSSKGFFEPGNEINHRDVKGYFEFFDRTKKNGYESRCAVNYTGGYVALMLPQKPIKLTAKSEFDAEDFEYPFFSNDSLLTYHSLLLRNTTQAWSKSMINEAVAAVLTTGTLRNTIVRKNEPALEFVNGKFYGLCFLTDKTDEQLIASIYSLNEESINIMASNDNLKAGSSEEFFDFVNKFKNKDLSDNSDFEEFCKNIDLDNFIDYTAAECYFGNGDWPCTNVSFWQSSDFDPKWRLFFYDLDAGLHDPASYQIYLMFADTLNYLDSSNAVNLGIDRFPCYYSYLINALGTNANFTTALINRTCDLCNTVWRSDHAIAVVDSIAALVRPEAARQNALYPGSCRDWELHVDSIRRFVSLRDSIIPHQFDVYYKKSGTTELCFDSATLAGSRVLLNSIRLDSFPWNGRYLRNTPVLMTIIPADDSIFRCWVINGKEYYDSVLSFIPESEQVNISIKYTNIHKTVEPISKNNIFPNPFTNDLTIPFPEPFDIERVRLLDGLGRELISYTGFGDSEDELYLDNLESLSAGVYFLNIKRRDLPEQSVKVMKK